MTHADSPTGLGMSRDETAQGLASPRGIPADETGSTPVYAMNMECGHLPPAPRPDGPYVPPVGTLINVDRKLWRVMDHIRAGADDRVTEVVARPHPLGGCERWCTLDEVHGTFTAEAEDGWISGACVPASAG